MNNYIVVGRLIQYVLFV